MPVRKLSANFIFDGKNRMLRNAILTADHEGRILELREPEDPAREEAGVEFYNGIIAPGFINTHCHLELSHLKGRIERGRGLDFFISSVVGSRNSGKDEIHEAIKKADEAMLREGIVAVGDISNKGDSFEVKAGSRIRYHTFIELFGLSNENAADIFRQGTELVKTAEEHYGLSVSLTPHSAYAVSEDLFRMIAGHPREEEIPLSVHNQESEEENTFISKASGSLFRLYQQAGQNMHDVKPRHTNSLPWLLRMAGNDSRLLLIHNVFTSPDDIRNSGLDPLKTWWALCPASNAYISGTGPNGFLIKHFAGKICIGTDSLASNDRLSVLEELKLLQSGFPDLTLPELLRFGCINGAEALGMESYLGSFDKGKIPGINLIRKADMLNMKLTRDSVVKRLI